MKPTVPTYRRLAVCAAVIAASALGLISPPGAALLAQTAGEPAEGALRDQIENINQDVKKKKNDLEELNRKTEEYRSLIMKKKLESASLEDQLALLDNNIAKKQLDIGIAKEEIRAVELEIRALDAKIADQEKRMLRERKLMGDLARKLYRAGFRNSPFEILAAHVSFSEYFDAIRYVADLQSGVGKSLAKVKELSASLGEERKSRAVKQLAAAARKRELETAKARLDDDRALKQTLLIETKSSELEYRYLLAEMKREQNEADSEISYLERVLREKLDIADRLARQETILSWPVVPARGLSTRFRDPEYPFRYIFEHPGVDIRADQGTPVRAAAAGIVARAKDAGYGYSYVMLLHNNSISTVYGHLSRISVKEDTFVERGEIIGYSGGMPGTPGAGRLTTGPHLHFETRTGGFPVDPMQYLVAY